MSLKDKILDRTKAKRTSFFLVGDILLISLSCFFAFLIRFDGMFPLRYLDTLKGFVFLSVLVIVISFYFERLYSISWSFVSISELLRLLRGTFVSFLIIGTFLFFLDRLLLLFKVL